MYLYTRVCIYIHMFQHVCLYAYACVYVHRHRDTCMHACMHDFIYTDRHAYIGHMHTHTNTCMHACMLTYICASTLWPQTAAAAHVEGGCLRCELTQRLGFRELVIRICLPGPEGSVEFGATGTEHGQVDFLSSTREVPRRQGRPARVV